MHSERPVAADLLFRKSQACFFQYKKQHRTNDYLIMFEILDFTKDNLIAFKVRGKIEKKDYKKLQSLLEKTEREFEFLKLFIEFNDPVKITLEALAEDFKTYFSHINEIDKVAIVGSNGIEKGISKISDLFIDAEIKYFPCSEINSAREWIG